jgi:hypothetical protein
MRTLAMLLILVAVAASQPYYWIGKILYVVIQCMQG